MSSHVTSPIRFRILSIGCSTSSAESVSHRTLLIIAIVIASAFTLDALQLLTPDRHGRVLDALRFVRLPLELSKLLEARSRIAVSLQQAGDLLQEHDRKEAEKNAPPKESDVVVAIRAFMEKWKKEESERIVLQTDSRKNRKNSA